MLVSVNFLLSKRLEIPKKLPMLQSETIYQLTKSIWMKISPASQKVLQLTVSWLIEDDQIASSFLDQIKICVDV